MSETKTFTLNDTDLTFARLSGRDIKRFKNHIDGRRTWQELGRQLQQISDEDVQSDPDAQLEVTANAFYLSLRKVYDDISLDDVKRLILESRDAPTLDEIHNFICSGFKIPGLSRVSWN